VVRRLLPTVAVNCVEVPKLVVKGVPFQFTVAPLTNPVPTTVRVSAEELAMAEAGLKLVIAGAAVTLKVCPLDVLPIGFCTVMVTGPLVPVRVLGTAAVN
jgi:hypothetical protein